MEKKQSSIDWLISCVTEDQMVKAKSLNEWLEIFEQAKAMHKEEIKIAWNHGFDWGMMEQSLAEQGMESTLINAEQYYNETFGGDNE